MSECTKGELEVDGYTYLKDSACKVVATTNHINGLDFEQQKANAKEIVRRWNAFEDGGIVEELKWACEKVIQYKKAAEEGRLNKDENAHEYWESVMSYVEAALAKI